LKESPDAAAGLDMIRIWPDLSGNTVFPPGIDKSQASRERAAPEGLANPRKCRKPEPEICQLREASQRDLFSAILSNPKFYIYQRNKLM